MRKISLLPLALVLSAVLILGSSQPAHAQVPAFVQQVLSLLGGSRPELVAQPSDERQQLIYGQEVIIDQPVGGDLIVAGGRVDIQAPVAGDLIVAGGLVQIDSTIGGSVTGVGGLMNFTNTVQNDVYVSAVGTNLESSIGDNAMIATAFLRQAGRSSIGGTLSAIGYRAWLNGVIAGNLNIIAKNITLDAAVGGTSNVQTDEFNIDRNAVLLEKISASVMNSPMINPNAQLQGGLDVTIREPATESATEASPAAELTSDASQSWFAPIGMVRAADGEVTTANTEAAIKAQEKQVAELKSKMNWFFSSIILTFIGGSFMLWLFPTFQKGMVYSLQHRTGVTAASGLLWLTMGLVASVLLMITIIGIPLGIALLLVWVVNLIMAPWAVSQAVGTSITRRWQTTPTMKNEYIQLLIGATLVVLLMALPIIGWVISMIVWTMGMGASFYWVFNRKSIPVEVAAEAESTTSEKASPKTTTEIAASVESTSSTTTKSAKPAKTTAKRGRPAKKKSK